MVTKHKIHIDYSDADFSLLAIHSSLDDHAMVYALNNGLQMRLSRRREDLSLKEGVQFPVFEWEDKINDRYWAVLTNACQLEQMGSGEDLFQNEYSAIRHHLIPERKEVDYFLKIESDEARLPHQIMEKLSQIPKVITCYPIDPKELRSIENLMY